MKLKYIKYKEEVWEWLQDRDNLILRKIVEIKRKGYAEELIEGLYEDTRN